MNFKLKYKFFALLFWFMAVLFTGKFKAQIV